MEKGKKILLIESSDGSEDTLTRQLSSLGYSAKDILKYQSLSESFSICPESIGVVLLDLRHEKMLADLEQLKNHFIDKPIVTLSDNNDLDTCVNLTRGGAQCLLKKSDLSTDQLEKAIAIAIARNDYARNARAKDIDYERHFNNGPLPMWIVDEQSMKFLAVNTAAIEKYGYTREEFSQMSILDIRPPEDVDATIKNFRSRTTAYYDAGCWRHKKKNGEQFYVHVYSHATQFKDIKARFLFAVDVDAKLRVDRENKELNELLKQQKEQLDSILATINDAIWSRDANTHELLYCNNAYYRLYGLTPGTNEPDKQFDDSTIHPEDRHIFFEAVNEVKTKGLTQVVYRHIDKRRVIRTLKVSAFYRKGVNGRSDTIDGVTLDITKEKEFYDAIRNSEQKLLTTINNTRDLIWSVDKDLRIIFCNKPYQDFFKKYFGVALDHGDYALGPWLSATHIERRKKEYARSLSGESFVTIVEEFFGDEKQYNEISSSPIYDVNGAVIGVNCVSRDITIQEEQLQRITQQNKKLREIAWIQSHKVRGPVAAIMGLISLVNFEEADAENRDILKKLNSAAHDLDDIIREIVNNTKEIENPGHRVSGNQN